MQNLIKIIFNRYAEKEFTMHSLHKVSWIKKVLYYQSTGYGWILNDVINKGLRDVRNP